MVRPSLVIPGVAEMDVRAETEGIERITIAPVPMESEASKHSPVPDTMQRPSKDPRFFTGQLWIMASDSWQIRFSASGSKGPEMLSIPQPAAAMATQKMEPGLGALLAVLGVLLVTGMVGIIGAATGEAKVPSAEEVPAANRRHA